MRNALVKDGWTITDDPFRIAYEDADVYADLRIVRTGVGASLQRALIIEIKGFTGIDDPYEAPEKPEILIETEKLKPEDAAKQILAYLDQRGYLKA